VNTSIRYFRPATKAHPAFVVDDLQTLTTRLGDAGFRCEDDKPLVGLHRTYVHDPFGNRIELIEVVAGKWSAEGDIITKWYSN
jgi:catechol 2,3-dioxygenase-like lactoylglutathione lyase family enzyme